MCAGAVGDHNPVVLAVCEACIVRAVACTVGSVLQAERDRGAGLMASGPHAHGWQGARPCLMKRRVAVAASAADPQCLRKHPLGSCCEVLLEPFVPSWLTSLRLCNEACTACTHDVAEEVHALRGQEGLNGASEFGAPPGKDIR